MNLFFTAKFVNLLKFLFTKIISTDVFGHFWEKSTPLRLGRVEKLAIQFCVKSGLVGFKWHKWCKNGIILDWLFQAHCKMKLLDDGVNRYHNQTWIMTKALRLGFNPVSECFSLLEINFYNKIYKLFESCLQKAVLA